METPHDKDAQIARLLDENAALRKMLSASLDALEEQTRNAEAITRIARGLLLYAFPATPTPENARTLTLKTAV